MASQIAGNTIGNILEVDALTHAAHVTLRPEDFGSLGIFSLGSSNGATQMAAGIAASSPIYSFRWGNASNSLWSSAFSYRWERARPRLQLASRPSI
jgi:hypothetical protein